MAIRTLVPMASVASVPRSIAFYAKLGFEVGRTHAPEGESEPVWAWLRSDKAHLMLAQGEGPIAPPEEGVLFYLYCDDVLGFRKQLLETGVEAGKVTYPFYARKGEFRVMDPDGYTLMVSHT